MRFVLLYPLISFFIWFPAIVHYCYLFFHYCALLLVFVLLIPRVFYCEPRGKAWCITRCYFKRYRLQKTGLTTRDKYRDKWWSGVKRKGKQMSTFSKKKPCSSKKKRCGLWSACFLFVKMLQIIFFASYELLTISAIIDARVTFF